MNWFLPIWTKLLSKRGVPKLPGESPKMWGENPSNRLQRSANYVPWARSGPTCFCTMEINFEAPNEATSARGPHQQTKAQMTFMPPKMCCLTKNTISRHTWFSWASLFCPAQTLRCFSQSEGLWKLHQASLLAPLCPLQITVSHFGKSCNISSSFHYYYTCYGDQWSLMLLLLIVWGRLELRPCKTANWTDKFCPSSDCSTDQLFPHLSPLSWVLPIH